MSLENDSSEENVKIGESNTIPFYVLKEKKPDISPKAAQGKSLYLRFPKKVPSDEMEFEKNVKKLSSLIKTVRIPRQKGKRFCHVDFESVEDRDEAFIELKRVRIDGKKLVVNKPKIEAENFQKEVIESKEQKAAKKRAKRKIKKLMKIKSNTLTNKKQNFTSTILIQNIPKETTVVDLKKHFPDAVDCKLILSKGADNTSKALVILPTPKEALIAQKTDIKIGNNDLKITFGYQKRGKRYFDKTLKDSTNDDNTKVVPIKKNTDIFKMDSDFIPFSKTSDSSEKEIISNVPLLDKNIEDISKEHNMNVEVKRQKKSKIFKDKSLKRKNSLDVILPEKNIQDFNNIDNADIVVPSKKKLKILKRNSDLTTCSENLNYQINKVVSFEKNTKLKNQKKILKPIKKHEITGKVFHKSEKTESSSKKRAILKGESKKKSTNRVLIKKAKNILK